MNKRAFIAGYMMAYQNKKMSQVELSEGDLSALRTAVAALSDAYVKIDEARAAIAVRSNLVNETMGERQKLTDAIDKVSEVKSNMAFLLDTFL